MDRKSINELRQKKLWDRIKPLHEKELMTLSEIGKVVGLSYERVRQIIQKFTKVEKGINN
mgnify:CR=1 FL=1